MAKLKEGTKIVLEFLQEHRGEKLTAYDIANATGLPLKSVNGAITAFSHKDKLWAKRNEDKSIEITSVGMEIK